MIKLNKNLLLNIPFTLGILLLEIYCLNGLTKISELTIIPVGRIAIPVSFLLITIPWLLNKSKNSLLNPSILSIGLIVLLFSGYSNTEYALMENRLILENLFFFFIFSFIFLYFKLQRYLNIYLFFSIIILYFVFYITADGRRLFSDDHATFYYRLTLLKEHFPNIPFYNVHWNAGIEQRDFFPTGVLNIFFIFSPLIYFFDLNFIYNFLIFTLLFILSPLSIYLSSRLCKGTNLTGTISALIAICPMVLIYRWGLEYGTLGFTTSLILLPLGISLSIRFLDDPKSFPLKYLVSLIIIYTLIFFWSASFLSLIPLLIISIFYLKKLLKSYKSYLFIILMVCINLPWVMIFWNASNVSNFVQSEKKEIVIVEDIKNEKHEVKAKYKHDLEIKKLKETTNESYVLVIKELLSKFRKYAVTVNNLILIFGIPGILFLPKIYKIIFSSLTIWLLFLGNIVVFFKPQLELDRMLVILSYILIIPSGFCIANLIKNSNKNFINLLLASICLSFLLYSPISSGKILGNRSKIRYHFQNETVERFEKMIKETPSDGRILFTGCIIHELSGGHLAPLTIDFSHPIVASSHVHNLWWYTQVVPEEFMQRKDDGIEEYLDLMNITHLYAHETPWVKYFRKSPEKYEYLDNIKNFKYFKRINYVSNYFYKGSGKIVKQLNNKLILKVNNEDNVIKFKYLDFLESSACEISKEPVSKTLNFIKLENCPLNTEITIKAISPLKRLL